MKRTSVLLALLFLSLKPASGQSTPETRNVNLQAASSADRQLLLRLEPGMGESATSIEMTQAPQPQPPSSSALQSTLNILNDPQKLNLLFSALVLVFGLAIYWVWSPKIFREHPFVERAFEFWILRWMCYVMAWGLVAASTDHRLVLATIDLNTILGFGFVVAVWEGDNYDSRRFAVSLLFVFGLLFSWDFVAQPLVSAGHLWLLPSMTMTLIFNASMAIVLLARCSSQAIVFAIALGLYLLMQIPAYEAMFIYSNNNPDLMKWLGVGKLLYSFLFYAVFPSALKNFEPIHIPAIPITNAKIKSAVNWAVVTVGGSVLTEGVLWAGKALWKELTGQKP